MIKASVSRGPDKGKALYPHRHADGMYVVSPDRFKQNYRRVASFAEISKALNEGLRLRMSNPADGVVGPRLICPWSIER